MNMKIVRVTCLAVAIIMTLIVVAGAVSSFII